MGRHYPYSHSTVYQNGSWTMLMGTNPMDGFSMTGLMISLPPWTQSATPDNDFKAVIVNVPRGELYAEVQFGYSRYIGPGNSPANGLFCTARADGCRAGGTSVFSFESEAKTVKVCNLGCKISIPAAGPNVLYYRLQSSNGKNWTTTDIRAVAVP
jgi:hypothetical protein